MVPNTMQLKVIITSKRVIGVGGHFGVDPGVGRSKPEGGPFILIYYTCLHVITFKYFLLSAFLINSIFLQVVMAEEVLSDALVNALSKKIDIALYPVSDFAVDLGLDFADASAAEEQARLTQNPQGKYEHLLQKFVATRGRGAEDAQDLIDRFKVKRKMLLVNFLEESEFEPISLKKIGHPVMATTFSHPFLCHQHKTHFGDSSVVR